MANRPPAIRRLSAAFLLSCGALIPLVAGCQNYGQYDLVTRELRMQEDQLYAMEAYMEQYQQLICKYREENERLRHQLADGYYDETIPPPSQATPRARNGAPATTPPGRPDDSRPPRQLQVPDVPPLGETSSNEQAYGEAALAVVEPIPDSASIAPAVALTSAPAPSTIQDVWLHGDVVPNDTGGGPRLVVEIDPLDADGGIVPFRGPLSLMLLGPDGNGDQHSLARWDFTPEEVQSAIDTAARQPTIRFHLELPLEIPVEERIQLWVRLLPRRGEKVLAHTEVDLAQASAFSSLAEPPAPHVLPQDESATALALNAPANPLRVHTEIAGSGWSTAKPGEPATLPQEASDAEWRASSEVIPIAVATSTPARPSPSVKRSAPRPRVVQPPVSAAKPPNWTPERGHSSSQETPRTASTPARPRWSPTR